LYLKIQHIYVQTQLYIKIQHISRQPKMIKQKFNIHLILLNIQSKPNLVVLKL